MERVSELIIIRFFFFKKKIDFPKNGASAEATICFFKLISCKYGGAKVQFFFSTLCLHRTRDFQIGEGGLYELVSQTKM